MFQRLLFCVLFTGCLSGWSKLPDAGSLPGLSTPPSIHYGLLDLINEAAKLHKVIHEKNSEPLEITIQELQTKIQSIYRQLPLMAHPQKKDHTLRLLGIIDEKLEGLKIQGKNKIGRKSTKKLFSTIAELAQTYHIKTASSSIFYCPQDRSLWLQSKGKPKNPINPHLKNCGRRVW